jgi:hypothetical protein
MDAFSLCYGPSQKICNVGQVANLPKTRQIGNLPHVGGRPMTVILIERIWLVERLGDLRAIDNARPHDETHVNRVQNGKHQVLKRRWDCESPDLR